MLGTALYYPHIDIEDPIWLRSAVLFWDSLQTIAPRAVRSPYKNRDTRILWKEGYLEPLRCDLHPELIDMLGRRVMALIGDATHGSGSGDQLNLANDPNEETVLHGHKIGIEMRRHIERAMLNADKLSASLRDLLNERRTRVHPAKLSPRLRDILDQSLLLALHPAERMTDFGSLLHATNRIHDMNGEWLLVNSRFADTYMSALAALLARETGTSALTNEESSMAVNLHAFLEDVRPSVPSQKKGALVSFIMEAIRVDPQTRVEKLLSFRRSRANQLAELSAQFEEISSKILDCETGRELEERVRDAYVTRIRPKLEALKGELRDNSIQSAWEGIQRAVTISVPAGSALAYFSGLSGTTLLAAGAAIAVTDLAVKTQLASRKTRRASPYTYLLDVQRKFSLPPDSIC